MRTRSPYLMNGVVALPDSIISRLRFSAIQQ
jgi:hypothetical protein